MGGRSSTSRVRTKASPCPVCGSGGWCREYLDGSGNILCMRAFGLGLAADPPGFKRNPRGPGPNGGWVFFPDDPARSPHFNPELRERLAAAREHREAEERRHRAKAMRDARACWAQADARTGDGGRRDDRGNDHPRIRRYMASRGLPLDRLPGGALPPTLRFHPECFYSGGDGPGQRRPAMLGAMKNPAGEITAVQRIYLDPEGDGKARDLEDAKKLLGSPDGGACRLAPPNDAGLLILTEGIETGLAVQAALGVEGTVWAVISCAYLAAWALPPDAAWVRRIVIAGDSDRVRARAAVPMGEGELRARVAANRLASAYPSIAVGVALPGRPAYAGGLVGEDGQPAGDAKSVDWEDVGKRHGLERVRAGVLDAEWFKADAAAGGAGAPFAPTGPGRPVSPAPSRDAEDAGGSGHGGDDGGGWDGGEGGGGGGGGGGAAGDGGEGGADGDRVVTIDQAAGRLGCRGARQAKAMVMLSELFAPRGTADRAGSCWRLAYHDGAWHEWVDPALGLPRWKRLDQAVLEGKVTRALDRFWQVDSKGRARRVDPTPTEVKAAVAASIVHVRVPGDRVPCWIPPAFDGEGRPFIEPELREMDVDQVREAAGRERRPYVATRTGLVDLEALVAGELRVLPPDPRYFTLGCLPFEVDAELIRRGLDEDDESGFGITHQLDQAGRCPTWRAVLEGASGGERDWVDALQECAGALMCPDARFEHIGVLDGAPGTGKSMIAEGIQAAIGEDNTGVVTVPALSGRFDLAPLRGKLLLRMNEFRVGGFTDIATAIDNMLAISSGNPVRTEGKHEKARVNERLAGKLLITCNGVPRQLRDDSAALVRRLHVFPVRPFNGPVDRLLGQKLRAEARDIWHWMLDGLRRAMRRGEIMRCASGEALRGEITRQMSPMLAFIEDHCILDDGRRDDRGRPQGVLCEVFRQAFKAWATEHGHTGLAEMNDQSIGAALRSAKGDLVVDRKPVGPRATRANAYVGIRLAAPEDYETYVGEDGLSAQRRKVQPRVFTQDAVPQPWASAAGGRNGGVSIAADEEIPFPV